MAAPDLGKGGFGGFGGFGEKLPSPLGVERDEEVRKAKQEDLKVPWG
jgi:hypothetical protein